MRSSAANRQAASGYSPSEFFGGCSDVGDQEELAADPVGGAFFLYADSPLLLGVGKPRGRGAFPAHILVEMYVDVTQEIRVRRRLLERGYRALHAGEQLTLGCAPDPLRHRQDTVDGAQEELDLALQPPDEGDIPMVDRLELRDERLVAHAGAKRRSYSSASMRSRFPHFLRGYRYSLHLFLHGKPVAIQLPREDPADLLPLKHAPRPLIRQASDPDRDPKRPPP
jgi:hypothetical protein